MSRLTRCLNMPYAHIMSNDREEPGEAIYQLMDVEVKLKGIAYLIESQGSDPCPPFPEDQRDIHRGIGLVLSGLSADLTKIRREVEAEQIERYRRNKRNLRKKDL